jgi:hypothetical protein
VSRTIDDIIERPVGGDVLEIRESERPGVPTLLRVIAAADGFVDFKEYGRGRRRAPLAYWTARLSAAETREETTWPRQ